MESINDKFYKKTKYDLSKETKRANFKFLNEKYPQENANILIGDSIIEIWNTELFSNQGVSVINRGISGDTSDRMYLRLIDNAINIKPKNIVILIGTNDLGLGAPIEFTFCNIEKIISLIKEVSPNTNIILMEVMPVNKSVLLLSSPVGKRSNELILELNTRLKKLADSYEINFYKTNDKIFDKKGRFSKDYTYDGLHPNAYCYDIITKDIIDLLK